MLSPFPWMHAEAVAELSGQGRSIDVMAGYYPCSLAVTGGDQPLQVEAAAVSPDFFHLTGVMLAAGRTFAADDANAVAIIDASLNTQLFGTDSALGRDLLIDGEPHQIIGVLHPDVARPLPQLDRPQLWLPLSMIHRPADHPSWVIPLAPLRDRSTQTAAQAELDAAVLGWALRLAAIGAAVGLLGALALGRVLDSLLHGVSASDPRVLLGAVIVLTLAVLATAWGPARRAARTDPMEALRGE